MLKLRNLFFSDARFLWFLFFVPYYKKQMLIFNYLSFCSVECTKVTAQIKPDFPIDLMRLPRYRGRFFLPCAIIIVTLRYN